jgi:hypothetical protein
MKNSKYILVIAIAIIAANFLCSQNLKAQDNSKDSIEIVQSFERFISGGKSEYDNFINQIVYSPTKIKGSNYQTFRFFYDLNIDTVGQIKDVKIYYSQDTIWTNEFKNRLIKSNYKFNVIEKNGDSIEYIIRNSKLVEYY